MRGENVKLLYNMYPVTPRNKSSRSYLLTIRYVQHQQ